MPREDIEPEGRAFTPRAILIGALGVAACALVTPYSDLKLQGTWIACCHLPISAFVLFLLLIVGANPLLRALRLPKPFTPRELIVAYCMMLVGAGIPSFGLTEYLYPTLAGVRYFATPENKWEDTFFRYIPSWFTAQSTEAVDTFYEGLHPGEPIPWKPWLVPASAWTLLALLFFGVFFCVSVILRKQWVEHERLIFPLVRLPIDMVDDTADRALGRRRTLPPFFRSAPMWVGFAIPFAIHSLNSLHSYFPQVPQITLSYPLNQYLRGHPWDQTGPLILILHFSIVGFAYLLFTELSFSLWFFFFFFNAAAVLMAALGIQVPPTPDYPVQSSAVPQMLGGFIVFAAYMVYAARRHLRGVFSDAFGNRPGPRGEEAISYRWAVWGIILGVLGIAAWCRAAGMSYLLGLIVMVIFLGVATVLTRFVSEGGMLFIQAPFRPTDIISTFAGSSVMSPRSLTVLAFVQRIFMLDLRTFLMPTFMDCFKLSESAALDRRRLAGTYLWAIPIAIVLSAVSFMLITYRNGGVTLLGWFLLVSPQQPFRTLVARLSNPMRPSPSFLTLVGVGAAVTSFLFFMRARFLWWPLHPMGFAMGPSWPMIQLWFSIMVGWAAKALILRYGGMKGYRNLRPFFFGLVVGEFAAAPVWLTVAQFTGARAPYRWFLF